MNKLLRFLFVFLTVFAATSVSAETKPLDHQMADLMELSGLNRQIAEFPGMVSAGANQAREQGTPIPEERHQEILKILNESIVPLEILSAIRNQLKMELSQEDIRFLLDWYKSALGKRITLAEINASTPEALQSMMGQAESLLADNPRVEIALELDKLTNSTNILLQFYTETSLTVSIAIMLAQNPFKSIDKDSLREQIAAQMQPMRQNIEQLTIISFVYAYKRIETEDQKKYLSFLEQPTTKKFNDLVMKSMFTALNASVEKMADSLAKTFKKQT